MIEITKSIRKEQGLYLITTILNSDSVIATDSEKQEIIAIIENKLLDISKDVDNDTTARSLKLYLIEHVFNHFVDLVKITDYIYYIRKDIRKAISDREHSKFSFVVEFK